MLTNLDESSVKTRVDEEVSRNPSFGAVIEVVRSRPESYAVDTGSAGLVIVPLNHVKGVPNRCRLKLFRPHEERERLCAFFYKKSNLAWSRDRFSYGAVEWRPGEVAPEDILGWLAWLSSGFDPDRRPARLKRAFRYTIPE